MMKTMKYYLKNIFLVASCLWLFTACNDFLTLYPEDDIVDDEYWETGEDVQSVVASCYRFMLEDNVISRIIIGARRVRTIWIILRRLPLTSNI